MLQHENKQSNRKDHHMKIIICILHGHRQVSIQCPKTKTKVHTVTSKQLQQVQIVQKINTWAHADIMLLNMYMYKTKLYPTPEWSAINLDH